MTGPLLTPEDIARLCGLSRRAVYDAIRRASCRRCGCAAALRIEKQDYDAWLTASRVTPQVRQQPVAELRARPSRPTTTGSFRALMAESGSAEAAA